MRLLTLIFISITLYATASHAATVYKWVDNDGVVHYSSKPQQPNAEPIKIAPAPTPDSTNQQRMQQLEKRQEQREFEQKFTEQEQKEVEEAKAYQEKVDEACASYEKNLTLLKETGRRLYTVSPDGEYHYFSEEDRDRELADTQSKIERYCTPDKK